jgi:hypothetical protein
MSDLEIKPSTTWTGDFTWDELFLRMHIKTVVKDYDPNDPRTWPLIQDVDQTENGLDYRKSKTAPQLLGYEQSLVDDFVQHKPLKNYGLSSYALPNKKRVNKGFRNYPLNFDRNGKLRKYPHILADELKEWVLAVKSLTPVAKEESEPSKETSKEKVDNGDCQDVSPEGAYAEIMRTLTAPDTISTTVVADLEEELRKTKDSMRG